MKYILIAGFVILIVFLIILIRIPKGIEPLTELYFENHTKLPKHIFLNQTYNFSFTIHNLEYINMDYEYNITAEYDDKILKIDSGTFSLENNQTKTIFENFAMKEKFEKAKINIQLDKKINNPMQKDPNLQNKTIDIHFLIEEIIGTTITIVPD